MSEQPADPEIPGLRMTAEEETANTQRLEALLTTHLPGPFSMWPQPPTAADVRWFAERGQAYRNPVAPPKAWRRTPRLCYENSARAVLRDPTLRYVQGYVYGRLNFLVPHAWVARADGVAVETTWNIGSVDPAHLYVGVAFTAGELSILRDRFGGDWYVGFADVLTRVISR